MPFRVNFHDLEIRLQQPSVHMLRNMILLIFFADIRNSTKVLICVPIAMNNACIDTIGSLQPETPWAPHLHRKVTVYFQNQLKNCLLPQLYFGLILSEGGWQTSVYILGHEVPSPSCLIGGA